MKLSIVEVIAYDCVDIFNMAMQVCCYFFKKFNHVVLTFFVK